MAFYVKKSLILAIFAVLLAGTSPTEGSSKILYIGDSLSMGEFGRQIDSSMRDSGLDVYTVVAGGASPYYWLKAYQPLPCTIGYWKKTSEKEMRLGYVKAVPKLEDMIKEHSPDIVVVQTGINLYSTLRSRRGPKDENIQEVRSLIDQMCKSITDSGAKSYWVLPPNSHSRKYDPKLQDELAEIMKAVVKEYNGAVFESQKYTKYIDPYPATDGIHYGPTEARAWAKRVSSDFSVYLKINSSYASKLPEREPIEISPNSKAAYLSVDQKKAAEAIADTEYPQGTVELDLRLLEKSTIANLSDVPYRNALGVFEYEVVKDRGGNYPLKKIRVAHGIVFNRKLTAAAKRDIGGKTALTLVPLADYPNLQTWQTVDQLRPNFEMPLYTPRLR